jgi:hypothetical protein
MNKPVICERGELKTRKPAMEVRRRIPLQRYEIPQIPNLPVLQLPAVGKVCLVPEVGI